MREKGVEPLHLSVQEPKSSRLPVPPLSRLTVNHIVVVTNLEHDDDRSGSRQGSIVILAGELVHRFPTPLQGVSSTIQPSAELLKLLDAEFHGGGNRSPRRTVFPTDSPTLAVLSTTDRDSP